MGKEIFIDANIFLEIFLDDPKADLCENFLKNLQNKNEQPVTSDFIIYSCFVIIQSRFKNPEFLRKAMVFIANYANLRVLRPNVDDIFDAIKIMEGYKLDFDDSLVVSCMKNYSITELASFDRHFDKIKGIKRIRF